MALRDALALVNGEVPLLTTWQLFDVLGGPAHTSLPGMTVPTPVQVLQISGYAAAGDGGGALYRRSAAEPSHAFKVQSADGAWWEGVPRGGGVSVHQFGAVGDGSTDDSAAFQAAIDYVRAAGWGSVTGEPGKTYAAEGLTIDADHVRIVMPHSKIVNNSAAGVDLFTMGGTALARFCEIIIGQIESSASAGHVLVAGESFAVTALTWRVREVFQRNPAKSIIKGAYESAGGFFDSQIFGNYWIATSAQTAPLFDIIADSGRFATNVIRINRITPNAGALAVRPYRFRCTSASTYLFANVIEATNFEVCDGGLVELAGCRNWTLRDLWAFDNGEAISADMVLLTNDGASGLDCKAIAIENYTRTQGAFSGASYDIHLENAADTKISTADGDGGTGLLVDCGNKNCTIDDPGARITLTNFAIGNSTLLQSGEGKGLRTDTVEAQKLVFSKSVELTIAAGAITATGSFHTVDTEADAATDDLDTINGGTTGMRLVLVAASAVRTVVLKDGTGNLALAGDCTLDNTTDTIELIFSGTTWLELSRRATADTVGIRTLTASGALILTDAGKIVEMNSASANQITIPANATVAFPVGTLISVTQLGAGVTTIKGATGVTVNGASAGSESISAQYGGASLYQRAVDEWVVQGALS